MKEKARTLLCKQGIGLRALDLLLGLALPANEQKALTNWKRRVSNEEPALTLAPLYRKNIEEPYLKGICGVLKEPPRGSSVTINEMPYRNEDTAFDRLKEILRATPPILY